MDPDRREKSSAEAEHTLSEQQVFLLPKDRWKAFIEALDRPPKVHPRMQRLFAEPSILEKSSESDRSPSIEEQIAELKAAGWIALTHFCWKAPPGSGCAGCFLGPHGAWKAMKRHER